MRLTQRSNSYRTNRLSSITPLKNNATHSNWRRLLNSTSVVPPANKRTANNSRESKSRESQGRRRRSKSQSAGRRSNCLSKTSRVWGDEPYQPIYEALDWSGQFDLYMMLHRVEMALLLFALLLVRSLEQQKEVNRDDWASFFLIGQSAVGETFTQCLHSPFLVSLPAHKL